MKEDKKDAVFHTPDFIPTCKKISTHVNHENLSEKWNIGAYPLVGQICEMGVHFVRKA